MPEHPLSSLSDSGCRVPTTTTVHIVLISRTIAVLTRRSHTRMAAKKSCGIVSSLSRGGQRSTPRSCSRLASFWAGASSARCSTPASSSAVSSLFCLHHADSGPCTAGWAQSALLWLFWLPWLSCNPSLQRIYPSVIGLLSSHNHSDLLIYTLITML